MIDNETIDKLVERVINRIEQGNEYLLKEIGNSIKRIGNLTPSKAQQLVQILKYGGNFEKIVNKLVEITELNVADIYKIFDAVAKENYLFAKQFYDYRGVKYLPYDKNVALRNQVRALAKITADEYINMSNTTAFMCLDQYGNKVYTGLSRTYQDVIDRAMLNVGQGKETFQQRMYKTIKELGNSGIRVVNYASGYHRRLDSAVRMNLQGALRDMSNELQKQFGEEFSADGIEISVHLNPAPDHQFIQGKQYSNEKFEELNSSLKRPIGQLNCYHYVFPIILGVNKPLYDSRQLQDIIDKNNKGFMFEGKHYTNYEGTQLQRQIETEIRKAKDSQILGIASGNKQVVQEAQSKITQLTNKYKDISRISKLPTKLERARVSGYRRTKVV